MFLVVGPRTEIYDDSGFAVSVLLRRESVFSIQLHSYRGRSQDVDTCPELRLKVSCKFSWAIPLRATDHNYATRIATIPK